MIHPSSKVSIQTCTILNTIITGEHITRRIAEVFGRFGLSTAQYNVLRILRGRKGVPANLSTIQEQMVHKMSNTTRLVDKLIQKGLVVRSICSENRRKVEILITPQGLDLLTEIEPIIKDREKAITEVLSVEEMEQLHTLLLKLNSNS